MLRKRNKVIQSRPHLTRIYTMGTDLYTTKIYHTQQTFIKRQVYPSPYFTINPTKAKLLPTLFRRMTLQLPLKKSTSRLLHCTT